MSAMTTTQLTTNRQVPESIDPSETLYRLTVDEYEKLADVLEDERVELIDGLLVAKMTKNPPHNVSCGLVNDALKGIIPPTWHVRAEQPARLGNRSMPEPDAAAVRGTRRDYTDHHPSQRDVGLVVEVSDTSLAKDRRRTRVYGAGGIPVYWIINLVDRQVEVYTSPTSDGYGLMQIYKLGENVPVVLDGIVVGHVAVADLLP